MNKTEMQVIDYKKIGLKCGIEIHQQLEGEKLFCSSPTQIRDDASDYAISRQLRAVVGETGIVDIAASAEMAKNRVFLYQGYMNTIGLVELDEEPPHPMNANALYTTLQITKLLNAKPVDEVQVMRKTVVDGSNTSGFQRTALVARNGYLLTNQGKKIHIPTIIVEEDAAKKVVEDSTSVTYNLSRLGIPLIEISTEPDMTDANEVAEVAEKLGLLLRSIKNVKRGLGTIRQDINISIGGGNRVEIKGAQDLRLIPQYVDFEITRQQQILALRESFAQMKIGAIIDITELLTDSSDFIKKMLKKEKVILAAKVSNGAGILGRELQPGKRVGTDLSEFAKIHGGIGGLMHSDEDFTKYGIANFVSQIAQKLDVKSGDGFILIIDSQNVCEAAFETVKKRLQLLSQNVPKEVRRANPDATTSYMRPMPGEARMYPETDVPPMTVDMSAVAVPQTIEQKISKYQELGLAADRSKQLAKHELSELFDSLTQKFATLKPSIICELLIGSTLKDVEKNLDAQKKKLDLTTQEYETLLEALASEKLSASTLPTIVLQSREKNMPLSHLIEQFKPLTDAQLSEIISQVKAEHPNAPFGLLMGKVMAKTAGRADGKRVGELLRA